MGDTLLKSPRTTEPSAGLRRPATHDTPGHPAREPFPLLDPGEERPSLLPAQEHAWVASLQRAYGNRRAAEVLGRGPSEAKRSYSEPSLPRASSTVAPASLIGHGVVQAKLAIGQRDDPLEHEADRVADTVLRMSEPTSAGGELHQDLGSSPAVVNGRLQRQCAACEEDEVEGRLQRRAGPEGAADTGEAPAIVGETLRSGGGSPLDAQARAYFEPRFGQDFSRVRVHTDARAGESARSVNALAYTVGPDIVFGAGRYAPAAPEGRRLLAHELTHVVQQSGAAAGPGALAVRRAPADVLRREAAPAVASSANEVKVGSSCRVKAGATPLVVIAPARLGKKAGATPPVVIAPARLGKTVSLPPDTDVSVTKIERDQGLTWASIVVDAVPGAGDATLVGATGKIQTLSLIVRVTEPSAPPPAPQDSLDQQLAALKGESPDKIVASLVVQTVRYSQDPQQLPTAQRLIQAVHRVLGYEIMLKLMDAVTIELEKPGGDLAARMQVQLDQTRSVGLFSHVAAPFAAPGRRLLEISDVFVDGVKHGFEKAVGPEDLAHLGSKLIKAAAVNALSQNAIVVAGMVYGFGKDVVDTIKGLVELLGMLPKLPELLGHLKDLLVAIIEDNVVAQHLGEELGSAVAKKLVEASSYSAPRLAFYIGELAGPIVIWTVLSAIGIGEVVGAVKAIPGVARVLEVAKASRVGVVLGKVSGILKAGVRFVVKIGDEVHHIISTALGLKLCSPLPCSVLVRTLEAAERVVTDATRKGRINKLLEEARSLDKEIAALATKGEALDAGTAKRIEVLSKEAEGLVAEYPEIGQALTGKAGEPAAAATEAEKALEKDRRFARLKKDAAKRDAERQRELEQAAAAQAEKDRAINEVAKKAEGQALDFVKQDPLFDSSRPPIVGEEAVKAHLGRPGKAGVKMPEFVYWRKDGTFVSIEVKNGLRPDAGDAVKKFKQVAELAKGAPGTKAVESKLAFILEIPEWWSGTFTDLNHKIVGGFLHDLHGLILVDGKSIQIKLRPFPKP